MFEIVELNKVCNIKSGGTPSRRNDSLYGGNIKWAKISDLEKSGDGTIYNTDENITELGLDSIRNRIFEPGTLFFAMYGSVGKTAIAKDKMSCNQAILGITAKDEEELYLKFLKYWLDSKKKELLDSAKGVALKNLSAGMVKKLKIPLPPLETQKQIAQTLDNAVALRDKTKQLLAEYDQLAQSIFLDMFGDSESFDHYRISEIAAKEKYSLSSGPFGSNLTSKHYRDNGVIILRGTNITSGVLDLSDVKFVSEEKAIELRRSALKPGDIVIVAVGSSGKALKIPKTLQRAIMSQNFNKITPDNNKIRPIYLEFCFNSQLVQNQFKKATTDTVRTFLSLTKIKKVKIPVPPMKLQNQFAEKIALIEQQKDLAKQELQESEDLFQALLQNAFRPAEKHDESELV